MEEPIYATTGAVIAGYLDAAETILDTGADINHLSSAPRVAVKHGIRDVVGVFIEGGISRPVHLEGWSVRSLLKGMILVAQALVIGWQCKRRLGAGISMW